MIDKILKQYYKLLFEYRYNFSNIQLFDLYIGVTWNNLLKCFDLICCEDIKYFETGLLQSKIITKNYFEKLKVLAVLEYLFDKGEMPIGLSVESFEVL